MRLSHLGHAQGHQPMWQVHALEEVNEQLHTQTENLRKVLGTLQAALRILE